jgi:hypothetical protein
MTPTRSLEFLNDRGNPQVFLTVVEPDGSLDLHTVVVSREPMTISPRRFYGPDDEVELRIEAQLDFLKTTRASARVSGLSAVTFTLENSFHLQVDIQHFSRTAKKCHLVCFGTGEISSGPCLTCPDGKYYIRVCC